MLTPTRVTHPCDAFGYPRGARGQNDPRAIMLHITGSHPTDPPLVGLDGWFGRPDANGGTQLGIQDHVVHRYIRDANAAWGGGYMDRPDLTNENVKRWWDLGINPNTEVVHIEVVLKPGPRPVARGTHLVSGATWETIKTVCGELVVLHPKIELVAADFLGHFQVDRVNRGRDPINAYWPEDVLFDIREDDRTGPEPKEEGDMQLEIVKTVTNDGAGYLWLANKPFSWRIYITNALFMKYMQEKWSWPLKVRLLEGNEKYVFNLLPRLGDLPR